MLLTCWEKSLLTITIAKTIISCKHVQCIGIKKTMGPSVGASTVLSFAGIELDAVRSEARLPHDQVMRCTSSWYLVSLTYFLVLHYIFRN